MPHAQRRPELDSGATRSLIDSGAFLFPRPLDPAAAGSLLADIRALRNYDESLFLTEAEFDADPLHVGVNPRPGRNLLERFEDRLGFVEADRQVVAAFTELLGADYEILNKKLVCGVPASAVPDWVRARIEGNPVNNLGAYVRPEYRDVTYFYGIDFHQDLIDYKDREADFVTLYVYLHEVGVHDAPLYLLEGSHEQGATVFPHDLIQDRRGRWYYGDGRGGRMAVAQRVLTGGAGFAALWHACTLHGTQPDAADKERLSLRYLAARGKSARTGIDEVNATLKGPVSLTETRVDLAADGAARMRGNIVKSAK
jgi:hypothetical protein